MKRYLNILYITFLIIVINIITIIVFTAHNYTQSSVIDNVIDTYNLGDKQSYIIQPNNEVKDSTGKVVLPANTFYTFILTGEKEQQPFLSGRQISSNSKADIQMYINKEIYITGNFSESLPLYIGNSNVPEGFFTSNSITLEVNSVKLVNE